MFLAKFMQWLYRNIMGFLVYTVKVIYTTIIVALTLILIAGIAGLSANLLKPLFGGL